MLCMTGIAFYAIEEEKKRTCLHLVINHKIQSINFEEPNPAGQFIPHSVKAMRGHIFYVILKRFAGWIYLENKCPTINPCLTQSLGMFFFSRYSLLT